jgi:hypothetical protein
MTHVPYKSGAPALNGLLTGEVDVYFGNASELLQQAASGRVRLFAVSSAARLKQLPDMPTIGEFYPGFLVTSWNGFFAPTGTPQPANVRTPSGALLKATLLNATIDMTNDAGYPSNTEGWGLARLNNTLFFPDAPRQLRAWDVRNADGLATGEFRTFSVDVASAVEPLKVTLVWTEPPGTSGAANPVINNLNLTVIAPNGTTFLGNVFAAGQSTTGGVPDALNNVEQVPVNSPAVGTWTVRVAAPAVNVGVPGQGFAVTATASTSEPNGSPTRWATTSA